MDAFIAFANNPPVIVQAVCGVLFTAFSIGVLAWAAITTRRNRSF